MTDEDMVKSTYVGCMESILFGTTTVCECCRYEPQITARIAAELGLRCITGGMPASEWFGEPLPTDLPALAENTRTIVDNPEQHKGLARAHLGVHSPYNCSPEFIVAAKKIADELKVPFNIHLAECPAELEVVRERYGKTPVRHLSDLGVLGPGLIADHGVWLTEEDMALFVESGAGIVHNPVSNAKLHSGVAPVARYLELGIPVGLATDSVVSNNSLNMFKEMHFGALMQRVAPTGTATKTLSAIDYLKMATTGSAQVLGMDDIVGTIEPGKRADVIVVELPPEVPLTPQHVVSHLVWSASPRNLRLVIVDGRIVARDGRLQQVDGEALRAQLAAYFAARWEEVGPQLA
jgi:5-methylthioadenosine/S-adenosylhomocysteine deaminase